jgi:hypothetical protein
MTSKKKILIYGTGVSAQYFINHYSEKYEIAGVVDDNYVDEQFNNLNVVTSAVALTQQFDFIVVASWAINLVKDRLVQTGFRAEDIFWFQHHKDRLVPWFHSDAAGEHPELESHKVLYAFYDLNVSRTTYDFLGFLSLADIEREKAGCPYIHIVIVPADNNEFNSSMSGIINLTEHNWRKRQILGQCCGLLEYCSGFSVVSTREEAVQICRSAVHIFPLNYDEEKPSECWEFTHLFEAVSKGFDVLRLKASSSALEHTENYLKAYNGKNKKVVSITLRDAPVKPLRNSNIEAWKQFAKYLELNGYLVVVIPDTDNCWNLKGWSSDTLIFNHACFNVELRMAMYESSHINLGVNNGPMHLCALSASCAYIMLKQITEEYVHSSTQSFLNRGFEIGKHFPGAKEFQKFVWENDDFDIIKYHFEMLENSM